MRGLGGSLLAASLTLMVLPAMPAAAAPLPQDTTTTADHGLGLDTSAIPAAATEPQRHGTMGGAAIQAAPAPTAAPTKSPTATPTAEPTSTPAVQPTAEPTTTPTDEPTWEPAPTPNPEDGSWDWFTWW
ncbi:hypothetical protein GCM10027030_21100 [Luteococcus sediminum]